MTDYLHYVSLKLLGWEKVSSYFNAKVKQVFFIF